MYKKRRTPKWAKVMDHSDIQPPKPITQLKDLDTLESMDLVNYLQKPYMDYLLHQVLPEDAKL